MSYARTCAELEGARFFSFLISGESGEIARIEGQPLEPLGWLQCPEPRLELVADREGVFAAYIVGDPPARPSEPDDCPTAPGPGHLLDAIFGEELTYGEAKDMRARAYGAGFTGGLKLERTDCSSFRVVVTGIPEDRTVQEGFRRQAKPFGFEILFAEAVRYPEVDGDVAAVR